MVDDNAAIHEDIRKILAPPEAEVSPLDHIEEQLLGLPVQRRMLPPRFDVETVFQGREALAVVRQGRAVGRRYALAFVDMRMPPGWDGVETIRQIWREDPSLQVVICSAYSDHDWPEVVRELSPNDGLFVLRKPFDILEIRQIAHAMVSKWNLREENQRRFEDLERLVAQRAQALGEASRKLKEETDERARMEVELRAAHRLEAVGQLASGIAHELNTPIQFVADSIQFLRCAFDDLAALARGYRELLARVGPAAVAEGEAIESAADFSYLLEEAPVAFDRVAHGTVRVGTIVRAMKEFAHPDQHEKAPADLNRAISNTVTVARNEYKYVATVELELGNIPLVVCHVGDINQVLLNLVVNAAHAIGDVVGTSGAKGQIRIATSLDGDHVAVTVVDSGTGIPESIRQRVYEPFFTTKEAGRGTGQGLAIARSIVVEKHGGTLSFDSVIGRGTTFTIRLPVAGATGERHR